MTPTMSFYDSVLVTSHSFMHSSSLKFLSYLRYPQGLSHMCLQTLFFLYQIVSALSLFSCSIVLCLMSSVTAATKSIDGPAKNDNATSDSHACQRHNCSFQCQGIKTIIEETSKRPAHASSQFSLRAVPLAAQAPQALSLLIEQLQNCYLPLGQQSCANLSSGRLRIQEIGLLVFTQYF